ncbi:MAG: hypothetical protein ACD_75C02477G0001 [uncultured bacterium]|nr:MAG: hypothetical protein ACD_75C02477G0001 [uncultured bacterium]
MIEMAVDLGIQLLIVGIEGKTRTQPVEVAIQRHKGKRQIGRQVFPCCRPGFDFIGKLSPARRIDEPKLGKIELTQAERQGQGQQRDHHRRERDNPVQQAAQPTAPDRPCRSIFRLLAHLTPHKGA